MADSCDQQTVHLGISFDALFTACLSGAQFTKNLTIIVR